MGSLITRFVLLLTKRDSIVGIRSIWPRSPFNGAPPWSIFGDLPLNESPVRKTVTGPQMPPLAMHHEAWLHLSPAAPVRVQMIAAPEFAISYWFQQYLIFL